jgi:hypothetical protein
MFKAHTILIFIVSLEKGSLCGVSVMFVRVGLDWSSAAEASLRTTMISLKSRNKNKSFAHGILNRVNT